MRIPSPLSTLKMIGLIFYAFAAILLIWMIRAMRVTAFAMLRLQRWWKS
jgi:hypothetical protein